MADEKEQERKLKSFRDLDYRHQILDEISLEGLDGITLQALWLRLKERPGYTLGTEGKSRQFVWKVISALKEVHFYQLKEARKDLIIHDRYKYIDGELGIVVEPNLVPEEIYPFSLVEDTNTGDRGSCLTYHTRTKLAKKLTLEKAEELGNKLVMVASQEARHRSVLGPQFDPLQAMNITAMQWSLLERIGRARFQGEITQGNLSLQFTNENPKTLFYHRKSLVAKGFLTKQVHHQKTLKQLRNLKTRSQNSQGTLFHLPRFYVERQPKTLILVKNMIEHLKKKPKCMATYEELKAILNIGGSFKKLLKTHEFLKFMQGDVKVPYRDIYPEATPHEWRRKGMSEEKMLRVVRLISGDTTPEDVFNNSADTDKTEGGEEEGEVCDRPYGVLDQSNWMIDRSIMWQAYQAVEKSGPDGISQQDLGRLLGHGKLEARTICRNLLRRQLVITVLDDRGRQRVTNFVAKKFETESRFSNQFLEEKLRNQALTSQKKSAKKSPETRKGSVDKLSPKDAKDSSKKKSSEKTKSSRGEIVTSTPKCRRKLTDFLDQSKDQPVTDQTLTSDTIPETQEQEDVNKSEIDDKETVDEHEESTIRAADVTTDTLDSTIKQSGCTVKTNDTTENAVKFANSTLQPDVSAVDDSNMECESQILMSISSDFQLNDKCKSPLKKREKRMEAQTSFRQLKRVNSIIEAVRHHKVIDDPTKLYKMIQENEMKEGYNAKMDKKSLLRILSRLGRDGQIKNITVQLELDDKIKNLHFVCEPHIDESNTVIQSAIEQAKMKFNSYRLSPDPELREMIQKKIDDGEFVKEDTPCSGYSTPPVEGETSRSVSPTKPAVKSSKKYGLQPKFIRMREVHLILFYLSRDYAGNVSLDQAQALHSLQDNGFIESDDIREISKSQIYRTEVDWKMFIPPLPQHTGWVYGWCLMCDVLLRLPLSVFVKLVHITMDIPGLQDYLAHPVKQHLLIRNLPPGIRNKLLHQRKYIFTIHEVATRLAYIGVIQFGPQKLKEKDQVFLYVNKNASLLDTTSSLSGYHQVESGRNYPVKRYQLTNLGHVERYWYDMWELCINTPLGESSVLTGQEITLEVMDRKPEMMASLEPRQAEEAAAADTGQIPGDGLGAAGLDSSIFAHLKRNWSWNSSVRRGGGLSCTKDRIPKPPFCIQLLRDDDNGEVENRDMDIPSISTELKVSRTTAKAKDNRKRKRPANTEDAQPKKVLIKEKTGRPIKYVRVVSKRKINVERKPYYDEKDKAALRLMRKLRVDWTSREDSFLLLCKAAGMFLCSQMKNQMVQYTSVRDLLHKYFPESCNKTSRACQRRLNYMMKNQTTVDNVTLFLADLQQDEDLMHRFSREPDLNETKGQAEARLEAEFTDLVDILITKRENAGTAPRLELPDTLEKIMDKFTMMNPGEVTATKLPFQEPQAVEDIHSAVLNTLVVTSLCSASDKRSWTFQLFKIYQQYPDSLLRNVMTDLRQNKMVSLKKHFNKTKLKQGNYLPLSSSPYQLSVTFSHSFLNRYQYDIYSQSWDMLKQFLASPNQFTEIIIGQEGGHAATVTSLLAAGRLTFRTEVPEQLVVLDPNLSAGNENYVRILERYKELLRNAGSCDSDDVDYLTAQQQQTQRRASPKPTCTTLFSRTKDSKKKGKKHVGIGKAAVDSSAMEKTGQDNPAGDKSRSQVSEEGSGAQDQGESAPEEARGAVEKRVTGLDNQVVFQEGSDARSNTALAKSASRIALYMMREEIRESPLDTGDPVQHSHDFFVISSCRLEGKIECKQADPSERKVTYNSMKIPISWLPGDVTAMHQVLERYGVNLHGGPAVYVMRNSYHMLTYVPLSVDLEEIMSEVEVQIQDRARTVLNIIEEKKELGIKKDELRDSGCMDRKDLIQAINFLVSTNLVIVAGIVNVRYVAHKYCRDWLIHTYKINRIRDGEKLNQKQFGSRLYHRSSRSSSPVETIDEQPETGSTETRTVSTGTRTGSTETNTGSTGTRTGSTETNTGSTETRTNSTDSSALNVGLQQSSVGETQPLPEPESDDIAARVRKRRRSSAKAREDDGGHGSAAESLSSAAGGGRSAAAEGPREAEGGGDIGVHHRIKCLQGPPQVCQQVSEAASKINWEDMEEILVQIRPWVRIDGSMNRRVLDRLLGAVLGAVMQNPGSLLSTLTTRFSPALQPAHARELLQVLSEIKAVNLVRMKKPAKPGLWSKPAEIKLEEADILDSDDEIIVEASVDAILLLGQFIGNKQYTTDFVCQCPCHPDRRM